MKFEIININHTPGVENLRKSRIKTKEKKKVNKNNIRHVNVTIKLRNKQFIIKLFKKYWLK